MIKEIKKIEVDNERLIIENNMITITLSITGTAEKENPLNIEVIRVKQVEILGRIVKEKIYPEIANVIVSKAKHLKIIVENGRLKAVDKNKWLDDVFFECEFVRLSNLARELVGQGYLSQRNDIDEMFFYFRSHSDITGTILSDYMIVEISNKNGKVTTNKLKIIKG